MISPPAVICLLSELVLKPPSRSYHTWQFVLCLYAVIQWVPFFPTATQLPSNERIFQERVPFCQLRGLMSRVCVCVYCSSISLEINFGLISCKCGCWLIEWMKTHKYINQDVVVGFFFFHVFPKCLKLDKCHLLLCQSTSQEDENYQMGVSTFCYLQLEF